MEKADPTMHTGYGYDQTQPAQQPGVGQHPLGQQQGPPPQYGYGQPAPVYGQPAPVYGAPPPQYGPAGTMTTNTVVVTGQPQTSNVVIMQQFQPSSYLGLAVFVCLCINLPLGLAALIFSILSQSDADSGNMEDARSKGRVSMWLSIGGILFSVAIVIFIVIYVTTIVNKAVENFTVGPY